MQEADKDNPNKEHSEIEESFIDDNLLNFLESVGPNMLTQLERNIKASAFDGI